MDQQQARSDGKDNKRAFRWGIAAFIVVVVLAIGAYGVLAARRTASLSMEPGRQEVPKVEPASAVSRLV